MDKDYKNLIGRLHPACKRALETAAGMCIERRAPEIGVAHLLHTLLDLPDADISLLLRHHGIDPVHWQHRIRDLVEAGGDDRCNPVFAASLLEWLADAWEIAGRDLDQAELRSGALLLALAGAPGKYAMQALPRVEHLRPAEVRRGFERLTEGSLEASNAPRAGRSPAGGDSAETAEPDAASDDDDFPLVISESDLPADPDKLGKYEILDTVASGSMGTVYLGHDSFINRQVAIKVARADALQDPVMAGIYRKMFFNELHTAGMLSHPNILAVYDAGVDEERYYIVMEYVPGGHTLAQYTRPGALLPVDKVAELIFKCAKALHYAHAKGVIHRDIKPSNILVTEDLDVKIADFSVAFIQQPDMTLGSSRGLVGSPRYMSPEQSRQQTLTNQTDIYSLGVVMYELLTGRPPFDSDNLAQLMHSIRHEPPEPPRSLRPEIAPALAGVLARSMHKERGERYLTGLEFATDLSRACAGLEGSEAAVSRAERFNALRALDFFAGFQPSEVGEVLDAGVWASVERGAEIVSEGDVDDAFYILVEGEAAVLKHGVEVGRLARGDCFGEMNFLTREKRTASVRAAGPVSLLKLNATPMEQTTLSCQLHFHQVFERKLVERLARTTEKLSRATTG